MKISRIVLENVKSFSDRVEFDLNNDFNILIGPNGSGKSNFLDIVTICMRRFLLKNYMVSEGNDGTGYFKGISVHDSFVNINTEMDKFYGNDSESVVKFTILISSQDIINMVSIKSSIELLTDVTKTYRSFPNLLGNVETWELDNLEADTEVEFVIQDNVLVQPEQGVCEVFLNYLNSFEFILILAKDIPDFELHPNYLFFSPYRSATQQNLQANLSGQNYHQELINLVGATSKSVSSLIMLASLYFAEKRRSLEKLASDKPFQSAWNEDEEVVLVTRYLLKLGYAWDLELVDANKNIYEILLSKEGSQFYVNQASSGEKEIINFLLGIFALNIHDGIIIIDEPELHLHPRWQNTLLALFLELANSTNNQFVISTHSPIFINEDTYSHITRIYKDDQNISQRVTMKDTKEFSVRDMIHIVNSFNNEKIFFADLVVLVEGLTDRLVFEKLLREICDKEEVTKIVEVIEVHGKHNLEKFRKFLNELEIVSFFIADLDFVNEVGTDDLKQLFQSNEAKIHKDVIKNSKSRDGAQLVHALEHAVSGGDLEALSQIWEYIKDTRIKLNPEMSDDEKKLLKKFITKKKDERIYILERGDIEDYFPDGFREKNIEKVIELLNEPAYSNWQQDQNSHYTELMDTSREIIMFTGSS